MRITLITLALIAAVSLGWSTLLEPYKNRQAVADAMTIYPMDMADSHAASEKYWAVRESQLTLKFTLQDYGFSALTLLLASLVLRGAYPIETLRDFGAITTPSKRWKLFVLGVTTAFLTTAAYVASLFLDASRDAFPPWADSLGIPLAGVPFIFMLLLAVAIGFSLIGTKQYEPGRAVRDALRRQSRPRFFWLLVLGVPFGISAAVAVITVLVGDFVFLAPSLLWLVFFALLFANGQTPANRAIETDAMSARLPPRLTRAAHRERYAARDAFERWPPSGSSFPICSLPSSI